MIIVYVPISQKNKSLLENQRYHISKLIGDGWQHKGVVKLKDVFGTDLEVVVLMKE